MVRTLRSIVLASSFASIAVAQSTWYVDDSGTPPGVGTQGSPYTSIQYALSRPTTLNGDTILVLAGNYAEHVDFLGKAVAVRSVSGAGPTTIDAQLSGSAVEFTSGETSGSVLDGFTLRNGRGSAYSGVTAGGGVYSSGASPTIENCDFKDNEAILGAGLAAVGGAPTIRFCSFESNVARSSFSALRDGKGGGVYVESSTGASLLNCSFRQNTAEGFGGGLYSSNSQAVVTNSLFSDNLVDSPGYQLFLGAGGGAASSGSGLIAFVNTDFFDNTALGPNQPFGAGLWLTSAATLDQCTIQGNVAGTTTFPGAGGGIWSDGGVQVTNTSIRFNRAEYYGGGIYGLGSYDSCVIESNCSSNGGGAYATGALHIEDSTIRSNFGCSTATQDFGGGVYGPADLVRCTIEDNYVAGYGGGTFGAHLTDCVLRANEAGQAGTSLPGRGGGALGGTLVRTRIHGNLTTGTTDPGYSPEGGGAFGATLVECAVHRNVARRHPAPGSAPSNGGGLANCTASRTTIFENEADFAAGAASSSLTHCTVFNNTRQGVSGSSNLHNCIVRANTGPDVTGSTSASYCNVDGGWLGTAIIDAPELFWAPFGNPSSAGQDFHLKAGSPGIDAGDPSSPHDPDGSIADLGAFAFDAAWCPVPAAYCTAKTNSLGCTPEIWSTGSATLAGLDDFRVRARNVIANKIGILFWGHLANATPFQGGTLCVASPFVRTPVQSSFGNPPPDDCSGAYTFHFAHAYMSQQGLAGGDEIFAQYWSRDPQSLPSHTGLTDALWFVVCN
jgi:predicted outer membrane repeat protein